MHAYLQRLLYKKTAKTEKAQLLINAALKFYYRDSELWQLLGEVYERSSVENPNDAFYLL